METIPGQNHCHRDRAQSGGDHNDRTATALDFRRSGTAFRPGAIGDKQGLMMRSSQTLTVLIAVAALAASCGSLHAQEFAIAEAAWSDARPRGAQGENHRVPRPSERGIDRPGRRAHSIRGLGAGKPVEKQFLTPFPSYLEPTVEVTVDGVPKRFKEKLHMYVGEARFVLARPPGSIDARKSGEAFVRRAHRSGDQASRRAGRGGVAQGPPRACSIRCGAGARRGRSPSARNRPPVRRKLPSASRSPRVREG